MSKNKTSTIAGINWSNIDLSSSYQRSLNILDPYSFDSLLLEVTCNLPVIDRQTVRAQFMTSLQSKIDCAKEVFESNLDNIVKQALKERE